jgi:hypothetical protein
VPGLVYLFGAPVYLTMGTSLATMIPLALVGGGIKLVQGFVDLPTGLLLGAGGGSRRNSSHRSLLSDVDVLRCYALLRHLLRRPLAYSLHIRSLLAAV